MERMKYYRGVKICPGCKGVGLLQREEREAKVLGIEVWYTCPQCEGSGRIEYNTEVKITEKPYKPFPLL